MGAGPLVALARRQVFPFLFSRLARRHHDHHPCVGGARAGSLLAERRVWIGAPHPVPFDKFYEGHWHLRPGIGGASTDLLPRVQPQVWGYLDIHYNSALQRYVMIMDNDTTFYYAESLDGLTWTPPTSLGSFADGVKTLAPSTGRLLWNA